MQAEFFIGDEVVHTQDIKNLTEMDTLLQEHACEFAMVWDYQFNDVAATYNGDGTRLN